MYSQIFRFYIFQSFILNLKLKHIYTEFHQDRIMLRYQRYYNGSNIGSFMSIDQGPNAIKLQHRHYYIFLVKA
jgi:hypothetical protein